MSIPRIVFIATPEFGSIVLEELAKTEYKPVLVISSPDKPVGRRQVIIPPPVKVVAKKYKIPVEQPNKIENLKLKVAESLIHLPPRSALPNSAIKNFELDLAIVASFGQIIPQEILDLPKHGFINVHPSLLPKYRGSSPIQAAILKGEKETGVSIIKMTEKLDAGPILAVSKFQIKNPKITYQELHNELAKLGGELLVKMIPDCIGGKIKAKPQDKSKATYSKILKKEDGKIDWQKPAELLERMVRAFYPWPGVYVFWQSKKLKITKADVYKDKSRPELPLGKVLILPQNKIAVQSEKDFLVIEKLQLEGKKEMPIEDFLRGHSNFIGAMLE